MKANTGVANVIFDAAARRFEGQVFLSENGERTVLRVSAPGHPGWPHRRIHTALVASAQALAKRGRGHAHS